MSSELGAHPLGTPHPDLEGPPSQDQPHDPARVPPPPPPPPPFTGSEDGLGLSALLTQANPDPLLGEFKADEPAAPVLPDVPLPDPAPVPPVAEAVVDEDGAPNATDELAVLDVAPVLPLQASQPAGSFDAVPQFTATVAPPPAEAVTELPDAPAPPGMFDLFSNARPPTDLSAPSEVPFTALDLSAPPAPAPAAAQLPAEDDEDFDDEPRGAPLSWVLLMSYSSAITLAFLWMMWKHRTPQEVEEPDPTAAIEARADPGRHAKDSRKRTPPPPIAADHLLTLGKTLVIGGLEVTPLAVGSGPVALKRNFTTAEQRDGGKDAIKLRLKLKNITKDTDFYPLDEAFMRERVSGVLDSFIELSTGKTIDMYPLAVESEWEIQGQEFKELKPGQGYETVVVSAADALERKAPEMTWRLRLRTGDNQTGTIGVRFKDSDIKPGF